MLALIENDIVIGQVTEGGWADIPGGRSLCPAQDGWSLDTMDGWTEAVIYRLATIGEAEAVPAGKRIVSTTVEMVDGAPKYVHQVVDITAEEVKAILKDYAAQKRFEVETGGVTVGAIRVATDRESQALINGAYSAVQRDPQRIIDWKGINAFVSLDASAVATLADAVATHVQAAFAMEATVSAAIDAGIITDRAAVDAAAWPGA